jgi:transposase
MTEGQEYQVFTDAAWAVWEPLIEAVRPHGKTPPADLRRTISAIVWRHQNGATWRRIPAALGAWWRAAQLFIRWAKQGVWENLLDLAPPHDLARGMSVRDGTTIRAHRKAAGAQNRGSAARGAISVQRLAPAGQARGLKAHRAAATAPRPA